LTRIRGNFAGLALVLAGAALVNIHPLNAQQNVPPAPTDQAPSAPNPTAAPVFPKPDPANFNATSPTVDEVNSFLTSSWGYDENRIWQVQGVLKTPIEGVTKVYVAIADKTGKDKPGTLLFWVMPGGKYMIALDQLFPFGAKPYADTRAKLQQQADGPSKGSASKELELVEFADFQCPHCKEAQPTMEKLATDFPQAHIVYQNYPLERIHPQAKLAAEYAVCVAKLGGNTAFFQFADAAFQGQDGLNTADGAALTLNSAVTKAGLDPAKVEACAKLPATGDEVEKQVKLAESLNINQTPTLVVNGRQVPVGGVPYETVKKIVEYQIKQDGLSK
jgi:protein-disulfide isomerase